MAGKHRARSNVEPGAKVEKGQVLVILEAMKMEHEIVARAADGTVASRSPPRPATKSPTAKCW